MEKPNFIIGSEKRFAEFISKLNDKDKITILTHTDLDGITSAKIVEKVIQSDQIIPIDYTDLNEELVEKLKQQKMTKIIITDILIKSNEIIEKLEKFAEILIIDHHPPKVDFNSEKTIFLNAQDNCATYLCYYLFSKAQDVSELDWLTACACIADWAYFNNQEFMSQTFEKYDDKFEIINNIIRKSGKFWELQWEITLALIYSKDSPKKVFDSIGKEFGNIGDLKKHAEEINDYINESIEKFEKEKQEINGRFFWEFNPKFHVGGIAGTLTSVKYPNKTIIIARNNEKFYNFSFRRQDMKENVGELIEKLIQGFPEANGGGHIPAAGGHVLIKDKEEFLERLKTI